MGEAVEGEVQVDQAGVAVQDCSGCGTQCGTRVTPCYCHMCKAGVAA
jgi:hypothetical protein